MMLCKCCTQYVSKFGKLSSGHRTGKGQFSFQYQTCQRMFNLTPMLISHASKVMLKILQAREGNGNPLQYSCLENLMGRGAWWAAVHGVAGSRTRLNDFTWRKWQPTPVFLPGKSQGRWSLLGCRLWGRTESDTTEVTQRTIHTLGPVPTRTL